MGLKEDLEKSQQSISKLEEKLKTISYSRDMIVQHLSSVGILKSYLEENLKFLKKRKIIALAIEYKKVKEDLNTAKNRIKILNEDKATHDRAIAKLEHMLKKAKQENSDLNKKTQNNVLSANFKGKKNGQK